MLISDTSPRVKGWQSAGFVSHGAFVLPSWFRGQKLSPPLPCQDSAEFCVLRVVHKPKAWSWDPIRHPRASHCLPRGKEPPGAQSFSVQKGTGQPGGAQGAKGLQGIQSMVQTEPAVMSPKQTRKLCVCHCSHTPVTQTSKLIAESLNALIG